MEIMITPEAKREIQHRLMRLHAPDAALLLTKQLPEADLKRGQFGEALWSIDRPAGWSAEATSIGSIAAGLHAHGFALDTIDVDGIRVAILSVETPPALSVDLIGNAIQVRECDA